MERSDSHWLATSSKAGENRSTQETITAKNISGYLIPPYSIVQSAGVDANGVYQLQRPSADSLNQIFVTDGYAIPSGATVELRNYWPKYVNVDATTAVGDTLGSQANSFIAKKGNTGLIAYTAITGAGLVSARPFSSASSSDALQVFPLTYIVSQDVVPSNNYNNWSATYETPKIDVSAYKIMSFLDLEPTGKTKKNILFSGNDTPYLTTTNFVAYLDTLYVNYGLSEAIIDVRLQLYDSFGAAIFSTPPQVHKVLIASGCSGATVSQSNSVFVSSSSKNDASLINKNTGSIPLVSTNEAESANLIYTFSAYASLCTLSRISIQGGFGGINGLLITKF